MLENGKAITKDNKVFGVAGVETQGKVKIYSITILIFLLYLTLEIVYMHCHLFKKLLHFLH